MNVVVRILLALLVASFAVSTGKAQTNYLPRLDVDGQSYTNVHIVRTTVSDAVIEFDGGAAKVALSNFPPVIQQQYGYDPEKARQAAIADAAKHEEALAAEAVRNAELQKMQDWRGTPMTATVHSVEGAIGAWTKCQISVSNKTETVLLAGLPVSIQQFFNNKNNQSNQVATLSSYIQGESARLSDLKARLPARPRANSPAGRELRQINNDEKALAQKRTELSKLQAALTKLNADTKSTRVSVRATAQTYASLPVWECVK